MIDRSHALPVAQQCQVLSLARSTAYYRAQQTSQEDPVLMRRMDELHDPVQPLVIEQRQPLALPIEIEQRTNTPLTICRPLIGDGAAHPQHIRDRLHREGSSGNNGSREISFFRVQSQRLP